MPYRGSAGAPTGRRSVERGEWAGFAGAAAVALIHALDDAFLHRQLAFGDSHSE